MRMMGLKTTIPMLILGVVGWTQATVITAENFNSSMPTDNWTFLVNGAVLTNNGPESVITATAGGKSLNVDITTGGVPQARNNISGISGADSGLNLRISFDYNPSDYSLVQHVFMLRGNSNSSIAIQLALQDANNGGVKNYSGGAYGSSLGTLAQGSWYHVEIVAVPQNNAGADTYDLTITDSVGAAVISATNLDFRTDVGTYDEVRWYYNTTTPGNDGQFYIDNLMVETIPEPATLSLIVGSAVVLLGVRRLQY